MELADVPRVPDHFQCDLPASGPATMMSVVLERSRRLCLQQYQKELFTPISYLDAYARMQDRLTRQQLSVYAGKHLGLTISHRRTEYVRHQCYSRVLSYRCWLSVYSPCTHGAQIRSAAS